MTCLLSHLHADSTQSLIGIKPFKISIIDSTYLNLHIALHKRLLYEMLPHNIKPALVEENQNINSFVAVACGSIVPGEDHPVLNFILSGPVASSEDIKSIPLKGMETEQILDLMVLKIRYFLEQNISGKLRISSIPLGSSIILNGITIGTTPAELILEKGSYHLMVQHEHLHPFIDTVDITSGNELSVQPVLKFRGYNQKPWIVGATLLTLGTTLSWILESRLHKSYSILQYEPDPSIYNEAFKKYRSANYLRIGLLNASALCWTVNGFLLVRNKTIKKKIFGK